MTFMNALQGVDALMNGLNNGMDAIGRRRSPSNSAAATLSQLAGNTVASVRRRQSEDRERKLRIEVMEQHLAWLKSQKRA